MRGVSAPIQLSCGLLVLDERGELLVGHSTGSNHWDLPKGLIDPGEAELACALREAREEFGLAFAPARLIDLGRHAYYRGKDLHLFAVDTTKAETPAEACRCTSYFEHYVSGRRVPEIDRFAWADDASLPRLLARSMRRLLLERGLLARARTRLAAGRTIVAASPEPPARGGTAL
jgi:8-oxo-dGTP pyrophosphatase MutT (NUDIX family)